MPAPPRESLGAAVDRAAALLAERGRDAPRLCAELLAAEVLGLARLDILLNRSRPLSGDEAGRLEGLVLRRAAGEPLAYILGRKEFYGRSFEVGAPVLVPRPETERIVDLVLEAFGPGAGFRFADICTGCANLAVTLAAERPAACGVATDLSAQALALARRNVLRQGMQARVQLARCDLASALGRAALDLVVANPPYLSREELEASGIEVRGYEPEAALLGGELGAELPSALVAAIPELLKPGGRFYVEIGPGQPEGLLRLLRRGSWAWAVLGAARDWQGRPRVLFGQRV